MSLKLVTWQGWLRRSTLGRSGMSAKSCRSRPSALVESFGGSDLPPERPPIIAVSRIAVVSRSDIGGVESVIVADLPRNLPLARRAIATPLLIANHLDRPTRKPPQM